MRRTILAVVFTGCFVFFAAFASGPVFAQGTISLPTPGTAHQVSVVVSASTRITKLPSNLDPSLAIAADDTPERTKYYKVDGCPGNATSIVCDYGDLSSKKLVILFGDSHAYMWLPAVAPIMAKDGYLLRLIWSTGCPAATLTVRGNTTCNAWRSSEILLINKEKPKLVILSERTTDVPSVSGSLYTSAQWKAGLKETIALLKTSTTKIAIIGDNASFANASSPVTCLSRFPTSVQTCATPLVNPSPEWADQQAAEKAAASAEHVTFINPTPWLCPKLSCSPIIGKYVVYFDWSHVTATYSAYLSTVMGNKLHPLL